MNINNNPSKHRPNRWVRLKKQLTQARADADATTAKLMIAQEMNKLYREEAELYCKMVGTSDDRVSKLLSIVEGLYERIEKQREEIQALKSQLQCNDTPKTDNTMTDAQRHTIRRLIKHARGIDLPD